MIRLRLLFGIVFTIFAIKVSGQKYVPATFVLISGKTINCFMKDHSPRDYLGIPSYKYKLTEDGNAMMMDQDSLKELRVNGRIYESLNIHSDTSKVKMKLLMLEIDGAIKVYSWYRTSYSGTLGGGPMYAGGGYQYYLKKGNSPLWIYRKNWFKKDTKEFFKDDPELAEKVGTPGYYEKDLNRMVEEYNQRHSK
jgi:hypothetical protein